MTCYKSVGSQRCENQTQNDREDQMKKESDRVCVCMCGKKKIMK